MKRIYVAGKISSSDPNEHIRNINKMIVWSEKVRRLGFAVFVPGLDLLTGLVMGDLKYEDYFDNSQPWLDASDAIFLVPGWEKSKGTKREIERAKRKSIPVYSDLDLLDREMGDLR